MIGSFQIGEQHADGKPYPDEMTWTFDLGDGVRADVTIRGERIEPPHIANLREYLGNVSDLLTSHARHTIDDGGDI